MTSMNTPVRRWLAWVAVSATAALLAFLYLKHASSTPEPVGPIGRVIIILCAPGLALDFLFGTHASTTVGYLLNIVAVAVGSGVIWGSLLFALHSMISRSRRGAV